MARWGVLLCSPPRRRALNLPLLVGGFGLGLFACVPMALRDDDVAWVIGLLLGGGAVSALALAELRRIDVDGGRLRVRTPYGAETLPLAECVLAIQMTRGSRGARTYTVYGLAGAKRVDLADAGSLRGAERYVARLTEAFLEGRPPSPAIDRNRQEAERREASWRDVDRRSAEYVAQRARDNRVVLWVALAVFAVVMAGSLIAGYYAGLLTAG